MELSKYEQETIIIYNEDEDTANIYTYDKKLRKKLESLVLKYPDKITLQRVYPYGAATFIVPKSCVSIREPYSDTRRAAASERMKKAGIVPPNRNLCSENE